MKIAVLGKGGSGKSSISWLLSNHLSTTHNFRTLAIDGDHNMDLTSNLNVDESKVKYFKDFNTKFRSLANMPAKGMWKEYFNCDRVDFKYPNDDSWSEYITTVNKNLDLLVIGLGDQDLMNYNVCSHGVSAPLKYMLPSISLEPNTAIVYDSVAGVDMLNYGIYFGFDLLLIVVEPHKNSIKVAQQISALATIQNLPWKYVINKFESNIILSEFVNTNINNILARISKDRGIEEYDYSQLSPINSLELDKILQYKAPAPLMQPFDRLKQFEINKQ
jgi:CO dehydrogenase maturation factor